MRVALIIRSYNRLVYLQETLDSILRSDTSMCVDKIVYDDCSSDERVMMMLHDKKYASHFRVVRAAANAGCFQAYLDTLNHVHARVPAPHVLIIDNDIVVKHDWIEVLARGYAEAQARWPQHKVILSGFRPTNAHLRDQGWLRLQETPSLVHERYSVGAACYLFSRQDIPFIREGWAYRKAADWGLSTYIWRLNPHRGRLCCLNSGVVNHIGCVGENSDVQQFDKDDHFGDAPLPSGPWRQHARTPCMLGRRLHTEIWTPARGWSALQQDVAPGTAYYVCHRTGRLAPLCRRRRRRRR